MGVGRRRGALLAPDVMVGQLANEDEETEERLFTHTCCPLPRNLNFPRLSGVKIEILGNSKRPISRRARAPAAAIEPRRSYCDPESVSGTFLQQLLIRSKMPPLT